MKRFLISLAAVAAITIVSATGALADHGHHGHGHHGHIGHGHIGHGHLGHGHLGHGGLIHGGHLHTHGLIHGAYYAPTYRVTTIGGSGLIVPAYGIRSYSVPHVHVVPHRGHSHIYVH